MSVICLQNIMEGLDPGPTSDDVVRAQIYSTNIMVAHGAGGTLLKYRLSANAHISLSTAVAPAWFGPAMHAALAPINDRLNTIDQHLTSLRRSVAKVSLLSFLV